MEQIVSCPAEKTSSNVYLDRKRKLQAEFLGTPFPKHACWDQRLKDDSSSDSSAQLKVDINILARESDSDPESGIDSNSFNNDADSPMSAFNEETTYPEYARARASDEPCTSSSSWGVTSSEIDLYSSNKRGSLSISEDHWCPDQDHGLLPSLCYEEHSLEFGSDGIEFGTDKELDNLLHAYGIAPLGRSADEDNQQDSKNLTIDKEFEQYFSMLML